MKDIFQITTPTNDEFEGIDLLYGLSGDSAGKSLNFFQKLAREQGIDTQQVYARIASTLGYPHIVDSYVEEMVLKLHLMLPERNTGAWELAKSEISSCLGYLSVMSENKLLAFPSVAYKDGEETLIWDIKHLGKHHETAGLLIPEIEHYGVFCDDADYFGDKLDTKLELMSLQSEVK